ncbi:DUF4139 domain-containing protein [Pseudomonas sp. S 311-6]|uniref:DUF4139 domain-containing protein n=1 Tax=Kerstersia gyiorum TaxID=206506 RepID=UPI0020982E47|nr:DUF4139 domain-containing protein [Pseudomonas sp. S 311-6]
MIKPAHPVASGAGTAPMTAQPSTWTRSVWLVLLATFCTAGVHAQEQGSVTNGIHAITLSSGGVAEIQRRIPVDEQGRASMEVPLSQVNDILKSLLVKDSQGGLSSIALDGLSASEETFRSLPFSADDLSSIPRLAAALQGIPVQATSGGRSVEGTVLGVATEPADSGDDSRRQQEYLLSVLDSRGQVQSLKLGADSVLAVQDDKVRAQLQQVSQVMARQKLDDNRTLSLALKPGQARVIDLSYVVAAPVWKTSYRLQSDGGKQARLQGWAILENATGEDWKQVQVTLTSGAPVVLSQRLHEQYWNQRPDVPVMVGASDRPVVDNLAVRPFEAMATMGSPVSASAKRRAAPPMPAPIAMEAMGSQADEAQAQESLSHVSFTLPGKVDASKGASLVLPLLNAPIPAEMLAIYRPGNLHPISGLELKNETKSTLPPGLVTVYDPQGAHAGDAELAGIPAGESRLLLFAEDRKVTVRTDSQPEEKIASVTLDNGVLTARHIDRQLTRYEIQGASDGSRTVLIEHPRLAGWTVSSPALAGQTAANYRLKADLAAGASKTVEVTAERAWAEQLALLNADTDTLLAWSGRVPDAATAARLKKLAEMRQQWHAAQAEEQEILAAREEAVANQGRIRENLAAVPADSTLGQRYAAMLSEQEDGIAGLDGKLADIRKQVLTLRDAFQSALRGA